MSCQVGCAKLQASILTNWREELYNAGCFNPGAKMDDKVTPSAHAKGEAIDIGVHIPHRVDNGVGDQVFLWLYYNRHVLGITQLIWDARLWSAFRDPHLIRVYETNPHRDHIHCQLSPTAARNANLVIPPFPEEDDMFEKPDRDRLAKVEEDVAKIREFLTNFQTGWTGDAEKRVSWASIGARLHSTARKVLGLAP